MFSFEEWHCLIQSIEIHRPDCAVIVQPQCLCFGENSLLEVSWAGDRGSHRIDVATLTPEPPVA